MVKINIMKEYKISMMIKKILLELDQAILLVSVVQITQPKYVKDRTDIVDWFSKLHTDIGVISNDHFDLGIKLVNGSVTNVLYNKNIKNIFIGAIESYPNIRQDSNLTDIHQTLLDNLRNTDIENAYACVTDAIKFMTSYIMNSALSENGAI